MSMAIVRRRQRLSGLVAAQIAAAGPATGNKLEITELRFFPVREPASGRSYGVLRVTTRSGLSGFGECARATADEVHQAEQGCVGRQATSYVTLEAPPSLAGALNMAVLDIIGKSSNAPVYRLLGGPTRHKVRALALLHGTTDAELLASFDLAAASHRAFRVPVPAPTARNQGRAYQIRMRQRLEALRTRGGDKVDFVIDGSDVLTPGDAASVATTVEPLHALWFDEPCSVSNIETIRKISEESVVPLGFGREIENHGTYQELLREGLIDVVRPDIGREGITRARRIAALAEPYYIAVAPNHEGGPVATAAALQLAAVIPNFFLQNIPLPAADEDRRMRADIAGDAIERVRDGFASLPTGPGLGITVNESALEKYHAA